jgi:hypothetical protein
MQRGAEIALQHAGEPGPVLDEDRPVEAEALGHLADLLGGRVLADDAGDRIAGHRVDHAPDAERGEQQHRQQLQQAADDVAGHGLPLPGASAAPSSWRSSSTAASARPSVSSDRMVSVSAMPGQDRVGRRLVEVGLAVAQHLAPARRRRRDADAEEGERRLEQDRDRGQHDDLDQDRAPGVRQHGAEHVVGGRAAERLDRGDEVALAQRSAPARG